MIIGNTTRVDHLLNKDGIQHTYNNLTMEPHTWIWFYRAGYTYLFHSYAFTLSAFLLMLLAKNFPIKYIKWCLQFSACPDPLVQEHIAKKHTRNGV